MGVWMWGQVLTELDAVAESATLCFSESQEPQKDKGKLSNALEYTCLWIGLLIEQQIMKDGLTGGWYP